MFSSKQKFGLPSEYYNEHFTLDILHIFAYYILFVHVRAFSLPTTLKMSLTHAKNIAL